MDHEFGRGRCRRSRVVPFRSRYRDAEYKSPVDQTRLSTSTPEPKNAKNSSNKTDVEKTFSSSSSPVTNMTVEDVPSEQLLSSESSEPGVTLIPPPQVEQKSPEESATFYEAAVAADPRHTAEDQSI